MSPMKMMVRKYIPPLIPETEAVDSNVLLVLQQPVTDRLLNNQVYLPQGDCLQVDKVSRRILDKDGKLVGTYSENTIINTLIYDAP